MGLTRRALTIELTLTALVAASALAACLRAVADGYLPQPFYFLKSDTLMDWFNTAYWANRSGAYDVWGAIYPPLSLDFLRLFSLHGCYAAGPAAARDCDWLGRATLLGDYCLNACLAGVAFWRADRATAPIRTVALALSLPNLYALERGNLVIPCLTLFILSEGGLLSGRIGRGLALGLAVNFKPYLAVVLVPLAVARRWTWLGASLAACIAAYTASFVIEGGGSPAQLLHNAASFVGQAAANDWNNLYNPTSYIALLDVIFFRRQALGFVPAWLLDAAPFVLIGTMALGLIGLLTTYTAAFLGRVEASPARLAAIGIAFVLSVTGASGYTEVFLLFLIFLEPWKGAGIILALTSAYLLSICADVVVVAAPMAPMRSWLSGQDVIPFAGYAVGQFVRPALVLLAEFGLIAATLETRRSRTVAHGGAIAPDVSTAPPVALLSDADASSAGL